MSIPQINDNCPFCQHSNLCQVNSLDCWCQNVEIPQKMIGLLPLAFRDKTCICSACIKLFNKNPTEFTSQYRKGINALI